MQKRIGERKRRDNMRRRARRQVGRAGIFRCEICGSWRSRQDMEMHHTDYSGYNGKTKLICTEHHAKKTKTGRY